MRAAILTAVVTGASALVIAAPAQAAPFWPSDKPPEGPCTTRSVPGACEACLAPLYVRPPQPAPTPYQAYKVQFDCGQPGAPNPDAMNPPVQGDPRYHQ